MMDIGTLTLVELAAVVEGFGSAFAALFALVGIAMIFVQIRSNRAIQREATAKELFRRYLQEGLEHPEFVNPEHDLLRHRQNSIQYEFFVANMLYSFDEVLQNTRSGDWREVVRGEMARHVNYLLSPEFQAKRRYYDDDIGKLIDAVCADAGAAAQPKPSSQ